MLLYIHFPFCKKKCSYCDFTSYCGRLDDAAAYTEALKRELELHLKNGAFNEKIETIFCGGGTPTVLPPALLCDVFEHLYSRLDISDDVEITLEANPGTITAKSLTAYRQMGINRLSIGLQSCSDRLLKAIGRIHSYNEFLAGYESARSAGFKNINVDLMCALPSQEAYELLESVDQVIQLAPEHISLYSLILEEGTPLADMVQSGSIQLPGEDDAVNMFIAAMDLLRRRGYERYEVSNFARPGFHCRHNVGYWQRKNYIGLGCAAASFSAGRRFTNTPDLDEYIAACMDGRFCHIQTETLTPEDEVFEEIMLSLRMMDGIDLKGFSARHGFMFEEKYKNYIASLSGHGFAQLTDHRFCLTDAGIQVQNSILLNFLEN